jgi:arylsulfatase A-like enzyme
MSQRPNILWICTDQQRYDTIHALGNPHIRTPHIDRLVAEGVTFSHAYSQSPVCTPSRACFLTGRYPRTTRCRQNGQKIPEDEVLITRMLADEGYDCGLSGKLHLSACDHQVESRIDDGYRVFHWSHHPNPDWPENQYIWWLESKGKTWAEVYERPRGDAAAPGVPAEFHQTTWCAEMAEEFVRERRDGPWLFSLNCFDPHHPFDPPAEYLERYDPASVPAPSYVPGELDNKPQFQQVDHQGAYGGGGISAAKLGEEELRRIVAAYYAMVELIDDQVGRLLRVLEETGQRDNTIVVFTSDHGEMLGDHGMLLKGPYFYDCAIRVPLILSWPGHFEAGARREALVELCDLMPTLLQACGQDVPRRVQGRSFLGLCTGEQTDDHHRDDVYCEYYNAMPGHDRSAWGTAIRTRTHKLAVYHGRNEGELYDLQADPGEHHSLWGSPDHASLKAELLQRCFDRAVYTCDPEPPRLGVF